MAEAAINVCAGPKGDRSGALGLPDWGGGLDRVSATTRRSSRQSWGVRQGPTRERGERRGRLLLVEFRQVASTPLVAGYTPTKPDIYADIMLRILCCEIMLAILC